MGVGHLPVLCPVDGLAGDWEARLALTALSHTAIAAGKGVGAGMALVAKASPGHPATCGASGSVSPRF